MRCRFRVTADLDLPAEHPDVIFEPISADLRKHLMRSGAVATMGATSCASCSRAHRLKHRIVRGGIDTHLPGRNTSDMTDTAGSRLLRNVGSTLVSGVLCKDLPQAEWPVGQSRKFLRQAAVPSDVSPGEAAFCAPWPHDGTGDMMTSARDNLGRINESRKGAREVRKESVNDRPGHSRLGLTSSWPGMLPAQFQRMETRWVS
jgi:hypothetical protein